MALQQLLQRHCSATRHPPSAIQHLSSNPTLTVSLPLLRASWELPVSQTLVFTPWSKVERPTHPFPLSQLPLPLTRLFFLGSGLWASGETFKDELAALENAISQYGTAFTNLIAGISVGSEDLYRNLPTQIKNNSGLGAQPADIVNYIGQVRSATKNTRAEGKPVGHVDTWTTWVNTSNSAVIGACDFLGMNAYPY